MAPSLMDRMSAWAARLELRGLLRRLRSPVTSDRLKATGEAREHMAGDERMAPALVRVLAGDHDELVRVAAAEALEDLAKVAVNAADMRRAMDGLAEAFRVDSAYAVRARSARTLRTLGWHADDPAERAAAGAMSGDLDTLRRLIGEGRRDLVLSAVARELTDGSNARMLPFIDEVGAGSPLLVGALERFVREREQVLAGVAADLVRIGISETEVRRSVAAPANAIMNEARAVLATLRASVAAPNDGAHGALRRVTGHSLYFKCPNCSTTVRKRDVEGVATALGWTACSACAASFSYADVYYHGKYDLPEVEGACFVCGASLRGPEADLSGRPCPSCGVMLPVVAVVS